MTKNEFFHSTPRMLKAHMKAYEIKLRQMDRMAWQWCGSYVMSAVSVSIDHCLNGRKAKSEYIKTPTMQIQNSGTVPMDDTQRQIDLFVAKLETMKATWDSAKSK